jgi:hypothetical protein
VQGVWVCGCVIVGVWLWVCGYGCVIVGVLSGGREDEREVVELGCAVVLAEVGYSASPCSMRLCLQL